MNYYCLHTFMQSDSLCVFVPSDERLYDDVCSEVDTSTLIAHSNSERKSESLILGGGPSWTICDITNSLEANPGPVCNFTLYEV